MESTKNFLYAWLGKNVKQNPEYQVTQTGTKTNIRFKCELRVPTFTYVAIGNSTSKKNAMENAARDFCEYLIREKEMEASVLGGCSIAVDVVGPSRPMKLPMPSKEVAEMGGSPAAYNRGPPQSYMRAIGNDSMLEEQEQSDLNSEIHGNWTMDNAKKELNEYIQSAFKGRKAPNDFKYTSSGPDHKREFIAEMKLFVNELGREIHAREHGSTKQQASKAVALSLVRQLYHLQLIGPYRGEKKKKAEGTVPFTVAIDEPLKNEVETVIEAHGCPFVDLENPTYPISLIPTESIATFEAVQDYTTVQYIPWTPPIPNWNPWTACNIDDAFYSKASLDTISQQLVNQPRPDAPNLPIQEYRDFIVEEVMSNNVILIRGSTGCGKTTQVPQYILDSYIERGRGADCSIIVTQPRRICAVTVSERIAVERGEDLGVSTGYCVRFDKILPRPYGSIMFCTVGILLRKLESGLRGISHIIVDEIHERDCNTDFLLVILKDILTNYNNIRVILMSATVDTTLFSEYFNNCRVIDIPGKIHEVQEFFLEDVIEMTQFTTTNSRSGRDDDEGGFVGDEDKDDANCNLICGDNYTIPTRQTLAQISEKSIDFEVIEALLRYIVKLPTDGGSILIFMPGWSHISSLCKTLQSHILFGTPRFRILPLHSQLTRCEQHQVFERVPRGSTKIIVSTNLAESSITIDDVVYVIDSCRVKQKIFTSHNQLTNYAIVWASKSNLKQRAGRAGRVCPGICFRLISRARFAKLDEYLTPEIFRTPLHELILAIKLLRLGNVRNFLQRAIEPPPISAVAEAEIGLVEMNALTPDFQLTKLGVLIARLPLDPKMAKMLVVACILKIGDTMCVIAAASSFSEPYLHDSPNLRWTHINLSGSRFSDHVALLNCFQQYERALVIGEQRAIGFCEKKYLNPAVMSMIFEARNQLKQIMISSGFPEQCLKPIWHSVNSPDPKLDLVTSLLSYGLYPNVCFHLEKRKLLTTGGKHALLTKLSVNFNRESIAFPSPFFVYGEKVKTKAVSVKQLTMITPLQLILFASGKIEAVNETGINVDDWIVLYMDTKVAAKVVEHTNSREIGAVETFWDFVKSPENA